MTDPPGPQPQLSPNLPMHWSGGVLEGLLPPVHPDWFDEGYLPPERAAEMGDWGALEDLAEADPPPVWGLDVASAGAPVATATEVVSGVVAHVAATGTGLLLEEYAGVWFDRSRFAEGVDLSAIGRGDVVVLDVEVSRTGKRFIKSIRFHQGPGE